MNQTVHISGNAWRYCASDSGTEQQAQRGTEAAQVGGGDMHAHAGRMVAELVRRMMAGEIDVLKMSSATCWGCGKGARPVLTRDVLALWQRLGARVVAEGVLVDDASSSPMRRGGPRWRRPDVLIVLGNVPLFAIEIRSTCPCTSARTIDAADATVCGAIEIAARDIVSSDSFVLSSVCVAAPRIWTCPCGAPVLEKMPPMCDACSGSGGRAMCVWTGGPNARSRWHSYALELRRFVADMEDAAAIFRSSQTRLSAAGSPLTRSQSLGAQIPTASVVLAAFCASFRHFSTLATVVQPSPHAASSAVPDRRKIVVSPYFVRPALAPPSLVQRLVSEYSPHASDLQNVQRLALCISCDQAVHSKQAAADVLLDALAELRAHPSIESLALGANICLHFFLKQPDK